MVLSLDQTSMKNIDPIRTRKDAEEIEEMLGKDLRKQGYGVWFN